MKNKEDNIVISLIKGAFSPADAADILLSFINDKTKFHTVKKLNANNENSTQFKASEMRIAELKRAKNTITDLILKARDQNMALEINSNITINMVPRTD